MHREHAAASSSSSSLPCILLASACLPPTHTALCLSPRWLRWRGAKPAVEITIILAVAYLSFYVGQNPAKVGGEAGWWHGLQSWLRLWRLAAAALAAL